MIVTGKMYVNEKIYTPDVVIGTKNPPGFEGSKQAEAKDPDKDNARSRTAYPPSNGTTVHFDDNDA